LLIKIIRNRSHL